MSADWTALPLGEFLTLQRGFDLPAQERRPGRVPIVSSSGVTDHHDTAAVKGPGVVTGRYGTIGQVFLLREDYWPLNTTLWVKDFHGNDPQFASYLLRTIDFSSCSDKSSVPGVNRNDLHRVSILAPPLREQIAIAAILGALDDKIELNRRINTTLEALVGALFQNMFINARAAKARSKRPDAAHARTWSLRSIYEVASVIYGAPFSSKRFNTKGDGIPLLRIRDLANEAPGVWTREVHPKGVLVRPGDIVVGMDGEFRAHLWGGEPAWLNQRVCLFAPKPGFSAAFVRSSIGKPLAEVEATETATTVIHLGKADIDRFSVVIPDSSALGAFDRVAVPAYERIVTNKRESRTLAALRDTLLPKLLSGELRLSSVT